eukprot:gnl/MRDRNA2_/MRDRNA2_168691_c0_seq1.p1 gnl/MRDRNA2_/MRDRNA2_168691_c0~~gnl/MRDRNA2_/MRDRNA2_168691_c0_seq1.p1  ORF type:complete len:230 (+),score=27.84 gnl/MRDRNA2_/MRDRNA2_168691_c0_seq1:764-1453(+)
MAKGKRMNTEINASSMADIAFLLLVFFLVTTTMDSDWGIGRKLPPPPEQEQEDIDIHKRNVLVVLANANDQLLVGGNLMDVKNLREEAKEFITNPRRKSDLPEWEDVSVAIAKQKIAEYQSVGNMDKVRSWQKRLEATKILGPFTVTKQVISLQNDRGTSYDLYIQVQNELAAAYRELRDEMAKSKFNMTYAEIEEKAEDSKEMKDKLDAIRTVYPQKISEAEPKNIGG